MNKITKECGSISTSMDSTVHRFTSLRNVKLVLANTAILSVASVISRVLAGLVAIAMARNFGKELYGAYETAFAIAVSMVSFLELGTDVVIVRSASISAEEKNSMFGAGIVYKFSVALIAFPATILIASLLGYSTTILQLAGILLLFSLASGLSNTLRTTFQAKQKMSGIAIADLIGGFVFAASAFVVLFYTNSIWMMAWARVAGGFVIVFCLLFLIKSFQLPKPKLNYRFVPRLLLLGLPFGLATLFSAWRWQIDILLLSAVSNEAEAGIYAASFRLTQILLISALSLSYALTPAAFVSATRGIRDLESICRHSVFAALIVSIPSAVGLSFIGRPLITNLFGIAYAPPLLPLDVLSWCLPCMMIWVTAMNALWGTGREYFVAAFLFLGLLVNFVADYMLIPVWGAYGAAVGALIGQICSLLAAVLYLNLKMFSLNLLRLACVPVIASAIMLGILYGLQNVAKNLPGLLLIEIAASVVFYILCIICFSKIGVLPYSDYISNVISYLLSRKKRII